MKATTTQVSDWVRKNAVARIARENAIDEALVIGCVEAGHALYTALMDAYATVGVEVALTLAATGVLTLVTA